MFPRNDCRDDPRPRPRSPPCIVDGRSEDRGQVRSAGWDLYTKGCLRWRGGGGRGRWVVVVVVVVVVIVGVCR